MDVPLRKGDDDFCFTEYFIDLKPDAALYHATFNNLEDADPEVHLENQCIVPEILKDDKWAGRLENPFVLPD